MVRIFCLGAPRIALSHESAALALTPKAMALFVYLVVTAAKGEPPPSRDRLADLLWSETNNQQARTNLRYLLPEVRRQLGDYLIITPQTIAWQQQAPYWLDVKQLRTTLIARPETITTLALQANLDLYQGEFLAGFMVRNVPVFEEWVVRQREEVHALVVQGGYTLAERYWQQADYQAALTATQRLLQWEPLHEAGHRLQMQLLVATGQRAAALAQYDRCRTILADELGVAPEATTTALYAQIRDSVYDKVTGDKVTGDRVTSPPETSTNGAPTVALSPLHPVTMTSASRTQRVPASRRESSPAHNLPSQLTPFFGRETEITQLGAFLADDRYRLVTLVGEGGSGKTRLALAVGQNLKFPDGVWFVGLTALTTTNNLADQLAAAVAQAVGLSFSGQQPLFTQLLSYLRKKALLLLFDNIEHLLPEGADLLVQILQAGPAITALVTSRHILGLQAEFVWRVTGLAVPPQDDLPLGDLLAYSSVALFVERAGRHQHGFQLTRENRAEIVAICRLVEGLPLAIELAAALTKVYSSAELYAALQQDYTILATRYQDLSPRHRSIQAMLDYSWRFLTPTEADAVAACAIFASGFTRAAALAVTNATPVLLIKLVDQSLLQVHAGRFFMHELVRQYAAAKLVQTPEHYQATAARHAAYTMQQLEKLAAMLLVDPNALTIFQAELDNVRLAWRWCAQQGDLALLAQGVAGLESGYRLTGFYSEAIQLLTMALAAVRQLLAAAPAHQSGNHLLASLLYRLAQFYRRIGQVESGECAAVEALALAQQLDDPALQGWAYHELTRLAQTRSDFAAMLALAKQSVPQAHLTTSPHLKAECLNDLGIAHALSITPLVGIPYYHEALQHLQGGVNRLLEGVIFSNLGFFSFAGHDYQTAYDFWQQALALRLLLRDEEGQALLHLHLGDLWLALGWRMTASAQEYEQAAAIMQAVHPPYWESWLHISMGRLHHLRGDLAAAQAACEVGRQIATTHRLPMQAQWARINLGRILADLGDYAAAHRCYQPIFATPPPIHWIYRTVDAYAVLADLLRQTDDLAGAVTQIETALTLLTQLGLAAANEPFTVYWTAVRIFSAANDPRATTVLRTAYHHLQAIAAKLEAATLRHSFLENVTVNRQLLAAAQAAGIT